MDDGSPPQESCCLLGRGHALPDNPPLFFVPDPKGKADLTGWIAPPTQCFWTQRGVQQHVRWWTPKRAQDVLGTLVYLHGYGAHVNRPTCSETLQALADKGFIVATFDFEGHGYSEGERCFVTDFMVLVADAVAFVRWLLAADVEAEDECHLGMPDDFFEKMRQVPYGLLGDSMGGTIALLTGLRCHEGDAAVYNRFAGVAAVAPAVQVGLPSPAVQAFLRHVVVPLMPSSPMPDFVASSAVRDISQMLADEEIARFAIQDDWGEAKGALGWRKPMKWATAGAFADLFQFLPELLPTIAFPFIVAHDPEDKVCFYAGSKLLMSEAKTPAKDKNLVNVAGGLHDCFTNKREKTVGEFAAFFSQQMKGR